VSSSYTAVPDGQSSRKARQSSPAANSTTCRMPASDAEAKNSSKNFERTPM
jgi:hypothetical protein